MAVIKALILVGGYGTRLRPFTFSVPKPVVPFCNKPMLLWQLEALAACGVSEVVLAVSYRSEDLQRIMEPLATALGMKLTFSVETEPLGTGGPLALAREILEKCDHFFVLNSDVTCSFPFKAMMEYHLQHGKEGTILVTQVSDPSKYGVVVYERASLHLSEAAGHHFGGVVERFVEKPKTFVGDRINAGIYLLNNSMLRRIELRPTSIERETFPAMAADRQLVAMDLPDFWMDVGQPRDFLAGTALFLKAQNTTSLVHPSAQVSPSASIGANVVIGPGCVVEDGARLVNCTLMSSAKVCRGALVKDSIVGWESCIGPWAHVIDHCALGEDVTVAAEITVLGVTCCPHKSIGENMTQPGKIVL